MHRDTFCQLGEVDSFGRQLQEVLLTKGVPQEKVMDIRLVLVESINNGLIHGNKLDKNKKVEVIWQIIDKEKEFIFCVKDEGDGIKAGDKKRANQVTEDNILQENGRGIYFIEQICDEICYNERGNSLEGKIRW